MLRPPSHLPGATVRGFKASERGARRGSSSLRRLLRIALLPDSVRGAEQPDGARLQPPLAPPPLPQTEDAPWRLEACVSSSARESGICSGALETPRLGARGRAHARLPVQNSSPPEIRKAEEGWAVCLDQRSCWPRGEASGEGGVARSSSGSRPAWGPLSARPPTLHKSLPQHWIALSPRGRGRGD
ncbi:hypothetical protein LEMLEM_LOCUS6406 [Lemmus lemmus]